MAPDYLQVVTLRMHEFEGRPLLVQGSDAPIVVFEGASRPPLICKYCNDSVLVENYLEECFVGIGLKCFKCGQVTWTSSLAKGEVFPQKTLTLGSGGAYLIGSSVIASADVVITCDQEIGEAVRHTHPAERSPLPNFELSAITLDAMSMELDILSGGRFNKYLESARRSLKHGNIYYRENPLAWSIELLKKRMITDVLLADREALVALSFLHAYRDTLLRWRHHAYFPLIAKEICAHFYHSLIQFIAASYISDRENRVAINPPGAEGRSADLYVRLSASEKMFLEVKGPKLFEWTSPRVSSGKIKKQIEKCLSSSRGQIDTNKPGILVIGSTCLDNSFFPELRSSAASVLRAKGDGYKGVAGICVVGLKEISIRQGAIDGMAVSTEYSVDIVKNKSYFKDNPITRSKRGPERI